MKPFDQISVLERATSLDPLAQKIGSVSRTVAKVPWLHSVLAGQPFGHSAHPMLVQIPIGAWVSAGWLDFMPGTEKPAAVLTGIGIAAAVPATAAGLVDYEGLTPHQRRVAAIHAIANVVSLACQAVSLRHRMAGRLGRGIWFGLAGTMSLALGGVLGGHIAHPLPDASGPVVDGP